ncbi:MAG: hypothetical protein ABSE17_02765 [Candidatus Levyibacteriota bacterium]|jgi:hypothetical protein
MYLPDSERRLLTAAELNQRHALGNCLNGLVKDIQRANPNVLIVGVNTINEVVSALLQTENNLVFQINSRSSSYTADGQFVASVRKFDLPTFRAIRRLPRGERPAEGNEEAGEVILEAGLRTREELLEGLQGKIPTSVHWN